MVRLPIPGSDDGQWGEILNEYLSVVHDAHGALKPGSITEANLDSAAATKLNNVGTVPDGSVTQAKLASAVQSTIVGKADTASLATVATSGDYNDLLNKPAIAAPGVVTIAVTTGSEARPAGATTVLWIGGSSEPTNMTADDLWFTPAEVNDTTAPSVPTGLASSNITPTSFTLSWSASTDDIDVTGYEIQLGGISYSIVSGTSVSITGRSSNTSYVCTVRARDAAGNWSAYSSGLTVTTSVSSSTDHTVFGDAPYPGALLKYTESDNITVATGFYTGATGWKIKGMRLYVPVGITMSTTCDAYLFTPTDTQDLANPVATVTMPIAVGQWNEVTFPSPVTVNPGQRFWVGYRFADTSYLSTSSLSTTQVQTTDGSQLYMLADSEASWRRNYYRVGAGVTSPSGIAGQGYGIDVIVSEV